MYSKQRLLNIKAFSGDEGYRGTAVKFVEKVLGLKLHISKKIKDTFSKKIKDTFAVLPKRWIVERTFAWFVVISHIIPPLISQNISQSSKTNFSH
uniref:Transposase DDE domain n=2 Tax=Candidatus Kentrum sp. TUN TaxID=2126343 RepID=A0A451B1Q9_9GAMM|nr:MAG: Transposase DDE domain [Candidatus Kentron sp. TUN]